MLATAFTREASPSRSRRTRRDKGYSGLEMYFEEINRTPLLDAKDEKQLARRVVQGDPEARDQLVRANLRLVVNIARHFAGRGVDLVDLIAEGNLGLLRAAEDFDPERNCRFSTYATHWVRQAIHQALMRSGPTIRIPAYMVNLLTHWRRATTRLHDHLGRPPTPEEVAKELDLPLHKLQDVTRAYRLIYRQPQSFDGNDHSALEHLIEDERTKLPDETLIETEEQERLLSLVDRMSAREAAVLRWRFGLEGEDTLTLEEIGRRLGVTRERVRQIEIKALEKLRKRLKAG